MNLLLLLLLGGHSAVVAWQPLASWTAQIARPCMGLQQQQRAAVARMAEEDAIGQLITKLRAATPEQLTQLLADNLQSIDQRLFLRLAEMSDAEDDEYEQLRIRQLATLVTSTIETLLSQADAQIDADGKVVQELLTAMSLDSGEFDLPIPATQMSALRTAIQDAKPPLDEGFVATVKAYMKKASDDRMDGMVEVLRILLQTFAAERMRGLASSDDEGVQAAVMALLDTTPEEWDGVLREKLLSDEAACGPEELATMLQDKMGEVVLGMPAGSAVQNVVAEYLNELITRTRAIAAEQV